MIHGMNHFTITAEDRQATLAYYCGLLGLIVIYPIAKLIVNVKIRIVAWQSNVVVNLHFVLRAGLLFLHG